MAGGRDHLQGVDSFTREPMDRFASELITTPWEIRHAFAK
jgi:hypothetical protein